MSIISGTPFSVFNNAEPDSLTDAHITLLDDMRDSGAHYKNEGSRIMLDLRSAGFVDYYPHNDTFKAA